MSTPPHSWLGRGAAWAPELARRTFRFSPAIAGTSHNEWSLHHVSSDEVVVRNAVSSEELAIPRRYFGDVSRLEAPVLLVALHKRLEYAEGRVRPLFRGVITMPPATDAPRVRTVAPAAVVPIREVPEPKPRWWHYLRISVALSCVACIVVVYVLRQGRPSRVRRSVERPARLVPHSPASIPQVLQQKR